MAAVIRSTLRERKNWLIHELYVRRDFSSCLRLIDEQLDASGGLSEYALYIKGEACEAAPGPGPPPRCQLPARPSPPCPPSPPQA